MRHPRSAFQSAYFRIGKTLDRRPGPGQNAIRVAWSVAATLGYSWSNRQLTTLRWSASEKRWSPL